MAALIEAAQAPDYPVRVVLVISNRAEAPGLRRAMEAGIATEVIDHRVFGRDREAFDRAVDEELRRHGAELICLAGFMRVLTPWLVARWRGRMLNIHPSLLPAYKGLRTHERALADHAKLHGATVHFVSEGVDEGPVVAQSAVPVRKHDTVNDLAARVLAVEGPLYAAALRFVASGEAWLEGNAVRFKEFSDEAASGSPQKIRR